MKKLFKKSRFYIGIVLVIQAFSLIVLCFSQIRKRKSLSATFGALSVFSAGVGALLLVKGAKEEEERLSVLDSLCGDYIYVDDEESVDCKSRKAEEIPVSDSVDESEFED